MAAEGFERFDRASAITPSDTEILVPTYPFSITTGNLVVEPYDGGNTVTLTAWPIFTKVPFRCRRVLATGTTSTVVGLS